MWQSSLSWGWRLKKQSGWVRRGGGHADTSFPPDQCRQEQREEEDGERREGPPAEKRRAVNIRHKRSAGCVAAQEGVEHGQLHALLVPPTPGHHRALAVGRVEVVAVARVRQAGLIRRGGYQQHIHNGSDSRWKTDVRITTKLPDDRFTWLLEGDLSDWFQIPSAPQPKRKTNKNTSVHHFFYT